MYDFARNENGTGCTFPPPSNLLCSLPSPPLIKLHCYNTFSPKRKDQVQTDHGFYSHHTMQGQKLVHFKPLLVTTLSFLPSSTTVGGKSQTTERKHKAITTESDSQTEREH